MSTKRATKLDAVELELFNNRLAAVAEEMGAVLPRNPFLTGEPKIGFVYESGGLERMVAPLVAHEATGQATQLLVDQGKNRLEG